MESQYTNEFFTHILKSIATLILNSSCNYTLIILYQILLFGKHWLTWVMQNFQMFTYFIIYFKNFHWLVSLELRYACIWDCLNHGSRYMTFRFPIFRKELEFYNCNKYCQLFSLKWWDICSFLRKYLPISPVWTAIVCQFFQVKIVFCKKQQTFQLKWWQLFSGDSHYMAV